jgi:tetratricopeptide (TPR) repeat protein
MRCYAEGVALERTLRRLVVAVVLLVSGGAGRAEQPATGARPDASAAAAPYHFALARLAEGRGDYREALAAFAEASRLAPEEPFLRTEYGRLLVRLGQFARVPADRSRRFALAVEQLEAAERLAAGNVEVLREVGLLYLELSDAGTERVTAARRALEAVRRERPGDPEILVPLGQIYRAQGELPEAVEAFRQAVVAVPGNGWAVSLLAKALLDLGRLHLQEGKTSAAETLFQEVVAADPASAEGRLGLAEVLSRRGAHAEAAEVLRALPADQARPEVRQRLVWELFMAGELEPAAELAERLAAEDEAAVRSLRFLLLAARGRVAEAAEGLGRLLAEEREAVVSVGAIGRALVGSGRVSVAEELMAALIERLEAGGAQSSAAAVRLELAELAAGREEWAKVELTLRPLAGAAVGGAGAAADEGWRLLWADALFRLGRAEEALSWLPERRTDAGAASVPGPLAAKRAEGLLRLGRDQEARAVLDELAAEDKAVALLEVARVYQRLERYAEALPWLERAAGLEPASTEGLYFLGVARERIGRREQAIDTFRQLIAQTPTFAPALNYLGYMWAEKGENLAEALSLVERAVALDPHNGAYVDSLGWAHFQLGQYEEARGYLERAAVLLPDDAVIFEHLGDLYLALGRREMAAQV